MMHESVEQKNILNEMPRRNPINGTFELTVRCNLKCKMCLFRHDDSENAEIMANELTADQWIDMARQAAAMGTMDLLITGGEPLLRPDFCKIWEGIYKQGFIISLYTNATLITTEIMELFRKYPPHIIGVTIYGASSETYEKVCGNSQAFRRMIDGIHQLQTLPSLIEFRTTLIKDNFNDAHAIDKLVENEFGLKNVVKQTSPLNKAVRGACSNVEQCRVSPEEDFKMKLQRKIEVVREIVGPRFDQGKVFLKRDNQGVVSKEIRRKKVTLFGCKAGMSQYTITYDGKLLACQMLEAFSTDAKQDGLEVAWKKYPYTVKMSDDDIKCDCCEYRDTCQSCYASRYAETGNLNGCSEYIYRDAKIRKEYELLLGGDIDEKFQL